MDKDRIDRDKDNDKEGTGGSGPDGMMRMWGSVVGWHQGFEQVMGQRGRILTHDGVHAARLAFAMQRSAHVAAKWEPSRLNPGTCS